MNTATQWSGYEKGEEKMKMRKWYAVITRKNGTQFTIGEYSEKDIQKTLRIINRTGFANLDECSVEVYSVEIQSVQAEPKGEGIKPGAFGG